MPGATETIEVPAGEAQIHGKDNTVDKEDLRARVVAMLERQGFRPTPDGLAPNVNTKLDIRALHAEAVRHRRERARPGLERHEDALLESIANGTEVDPARITPVLVPVAPKSREELLFRYACLHWSIPVSSGYGRRLRFLVMDAANGKLVGLLGLGDPVFSLKDRDHWIGWDFETRRERLHHVMDAFVLGAVPPYSNLLCGKLVALLVSSNEVRAAASQKYGHHTTRIRERALDGQLVLVTTTSALGRSSIYNRVRYHDELVYHAVGWTSGFGEIQFINGLYEELRTYALQNATPTAKQRKWGSGFRNRREVVKKCLASLNCPVSWQNHRIRREIFVVPLAANAREFLVGLNSRPKFYDRDVEELSRYALSRWVLPRAERDGRYRTFERESWRLWT